jgi:hypothetical protein
MSFGDYSDSPAGGRRRAPSFLMASSHGGSSSLRDADFSCGHRSHYGPQPANHRPRQNSVIFNMQIPQLFPVIWHANQVVVFATSHFMTSARKVKSAMDLQTLVLREETEENVHAMTHLSPSSSISPCHQRDDAITEMPEIHSTSFSQITSV